MSDSRCAGQLSSGSENDELVAQIERMKQGIRYALGHLEDQSGIGDGFGEAVDSLKALLGEGPYAG